MKDKILISHPTLGFITFEDLINDLESMLEDTTFFEDIITNILDYTEMTNEDITTIFNYSIIERLKWIIDILKSSN